jgi:Peptidase inhibitor family I36
VSATVTRSRTLTVGATAAAMASAAAVAVVAPAPDAGAHDGVPHTAYDCNGPTLCVWDRMTQLGPAGSMSELSESVPRLDIEPWQHEADPGHPHTMDNTIQVVTNQTTSYWVLYDGFFRAGPIACVRPGQTLDLVAAGHKNQTSSLVRFEHGCVEP